MSTMDPDIVLLLLTGNYATNPNLRDLILNVFPEFPQRPLTQDQAIAIGEERPDDIFLRQSEDGTGMIIDAMPAAVEQTVTDAAPPNNNRSTPETTETEEDLRSAREEADRRVAEQVFYWIYRLVDQLRREALERELWRGRLMEIQARIRFGVPDWRMEEEEGEEPEAERRTFERMPPVGPIPSRYSRPRRRARYMPGRPAGEASRQH